MSVRALSLTWAHNLHLAAAFMAVLRPVIAAVVAGGLHGKRPDMQLDGKQDKVSQDGLPLTFALRRCISEMYERMRSRGLSG